MAIYPYPAHLVTYWQLPDGTEVTLRLLATLGFAVVDNADDATVKRVTKTLILEATSGQASHESPHGTCSGGIPIEV
ncbi:MAG: hypothetical protein AB1513_07260 [Pseudomonadota bacterium]